MAKPKQGSVQNRHIYTRASYLYQAAQYLASHQSQPQRQDAQSNDGTVQHSAEAQRQLRADSTRNLSRQMITDMRIVSQKILIRQSPNLKRSICKYCDTLQIEGQTCITTVENQSKGGRKPWADVLTIKCETCGHVKRFPVAAPRQRRRPVRELEAEALKVPKEETEAVDVQMEQAT